MASKVPRQLARGQRFHERVRAGWTRIAPSPAVRAERAVTKYGGRRGRVDVWLDAETTFAIVVEIKSTDWQRVLRRRVREYVRRHGLQLHDYLAGADLEGRDVSMHVVYPRAPSDARLRALVEEGMLSMGVVVLWWADQSAPSGPSFPTVLGVNWR
jgi:hypothetical protein